MKEKISPAEISTSPLPPKSRYLRKRRFEMLAQWYGQERAEREITAHTAEPQSIGVLLDNILVKIRRPENGVLIKLKSRWNAFAGGSFARFTTPETLRNGVLTLKVRHSALLMELQPSLDLLRDNINRELGETVCREIKLTVG